MAISFIGSATNASTGASFDITLPTCLEDDIVIVITGWVWNGDVAPGVTTSGYTELAELYANGSKDINLSVNWKRMGGTPDTTATCIGPDSSAAEGIGIAYVLRGVDPTTALDVTTTTDTGVGSNDPNAPSITPVTADTLVVACGACSNADASGGDSSVPTLSGYSNQVTRASIDVLFDATFMMASKVWSGSGAEDPPAWDVDAGTPGDSTWAAATIALRAESIIEPPTGSLALTGSTPAIAPTPPTGALTFTGGTPVPAVAIPVAPTTGALTLTGTTPTPIVAVAVAPSTDQMQITGGTPRVDHNILSVTLPVLTPALEMKGATTALDIEIPLPIFLGSMSGASWMDVTLPVFDVLFTSGGSLVVDLPELDFGLAAVTGATCTLDVSLPELSFASVAGAGMSVGIPPLEVLLAGTNGTAASLVASLPTLEVLLEARVETLAQLVVTLPSFQSVFTSKQDILSQLDVKMPTLSCLLGASVGSIATLDVNLPALEALLTRYEDITGGLVVELPVFRAFLEMSHAGRFDTSTAAEIANTILKWRRPS